MNKLIFEFIGAFWLVLGGCSCSFFMIGVSLVDKTIVPESIVN
ncbi:hypothetical protein [Cerina litoralis]|nr:hypothetical protein [Cerina litoralis]